MPHKSPPTTVGTVGTGRKLAWATMAAALCAISSTQARAQGCVASRGAGAPTACGLPNSEGGEHDMGHGFQATVAYRWLHSDRMFSEDIEQPASVVDPQINDSHFVDLSLSYTITPRFSATLTLPYVSHDRSQIVRRLNLARTILGTYHTKASGIGDIRLEGGAWLLDPATHMKGNLQLNLGLSAPTGDRDVTDTFAFGNSTTIPSAGIRSVDPSIQPGSGGWGIILGLYGYRELVPRLNVFLNGAYTITPAEKYTPTASSVAGYTDYSIADSYSGRGGLEYLVWPSHSVWLSLAARIDGVPVDDLAGGNQGFRRPGYSVAIDPGVSASYKSWTFSFDTPVAIARARLQNVAEMAANAPAAAAGFADFQVLFNISKRF